MTKTYKSGKQFRVLCWTLAVVMAVFVITIPVSIALVWFCYRTQLTVRDDHMEFTWFGTRTILFDDISSLKWVNSGGLMRPIAYGLESDPNKAPRLPIGAFDEGDEIVETIQNKTELTVE